MSACHSLSDPELFLLIKEGNAAAFTELHTRYYPVLYRHACMKLDDREEIKDMLQELFSLIWNERTVLTIEHNISGYLYSSIRNRILNVYKHKNVRNYHLASLQEYFMANTVFEPDEIIRVRQLQQIIEAELSKLPRQTRRIFQMSRTQQLTHQEIADELDISVLTVRKQVQNTLKVLRVKLGVLFIFMVF